MIDKNVLNTSTLTSTLPSFYATADQKALMKEAANNLTAFNIVIENNNRSEVLNQLSLDHLNFDDHIDIEKMENDNMFLRQVTSWFNYTNHLVWCLNATNNFSSDTSFNLVLSEMLINSTTEIDNHVQKHKTLCIEVFYLMYIKFMEVLKIPVTLGERSVRMFELINEFNNK